MFFCRSIGCSNPVQTDDDFCPECQKHQQQNAQALQRGNEPQSMAEKYPQYYKSVGNLTEVDVYAIHHLFEIQDPSGAIQHASKKLLLSGVRTGGKSKLDDIREARDTLTRYLQLNEDIQ